MISDGHLNGRALAADAVIGAGADQAKDLVGKVSERTFNQPLDAGGQETLARLANTGPKSLKGGFNINSKNGGAAIRSGSVGSSIEVGKNLLTNDIDKRITISSVWGLSDMTSKAPRPSGAGSGVRTAVIAVACVIAGLAISVGANGARFGGAVAAAVIGAASMLAVLGVALTVRKAWVLWLGVVLVLIVGSALCGRVAQPYLAAWFFGYLGGGPVLLDAVSRFGKAPGHDEPDGTTVSAKHH